MDVLIQAVVAILVVVFLYWLAGQLPDAMQKIARIIVVAGGCLWLLFRASAILHAIAGH